jgi:hypothetical protein
MSLEDLHGRPKRPHRCLGILTELIPRLLLPLIVKDEEGFRGAVGPEPKRLRASLIRIVPREDEVAAPQDGPRFYTPSSKASGPPVVDTSGTPSAKETGSRSATSSSGTSTISASAATGGSTGRTTIVSAEAGVGADNTSGGLKAAAASAISPGTTAASTEGSAWGACPMATCAAWAPRLGASGAEAGRPAWRGAALAAEAGAVLRAFLGARSAEPCLRLLGGKGKAGSGHTKKEPGHRYPQILTRSGPRPIVPVGRPLGPRSPQAPPRFALLPASASFPLRAPEAPKGRPAHATSRRLEDQPPVRLAQATTRGGQAG